jgi:hypothetical protein
MYRKRTYQERFWEILPGLQFWTVFLSAIYLSYAKPVWASIFIICFDFYWLLRAINASLHLIASYIKFKTAVKINWLHYTENLNALPKLIESINTQIKAKPNKFLSELNKKLQQAQISHHPIPNFLTFYHLVLIPFVNEPFEVLDNSLSALANSAYPKNRIMILLACESRAGEGAKVTANLLKTKYEKEFFKFYITEHPDNLPDEIKGKSANASYAIQTILPELKKNNIEVDQVLVSNFDSDTIIHPQYFARVMFEFLLADKPYQKSYQPIAIYNNNIWDSPALIRVIALSSWQFTESNRPDRLKTFSSHTMTLKALIDVGFWRKDIVNEDEFIYWQCFLHYQGDYQVIPLFLPVSLDTCLAPSFWQTCKNQYKQKRRWAYGVEYYPHLIWPLIKCKTSFYWKFYKLFQYTETHFTWATASLMIAILGWLPLFIGRANFTESVIAFNLPLVTQSLMRIALLFLIFSVYVNIVLLPPKPKKYGKWKTISMYLQWFLVPFSAVVFHSLPAIEAQTRLMLGKYLEFWVTPKARKGENTGFLMKEMGESK